LVPQVVVTDGSPLYPTLLAETWPGAEHQLCVFHVLQDIYDEVLKAVRRIAQEMRRRGRRGRKRRRGAASKIALRRRRQRERTGVRAQAKAVYRQRHLIVKRWDRLSFGEHRQLKQLLTWAPGLRLLREFADEVQEVFGAAQSERSAWRRHAALRGNAAYQGVPELAQALALMPEEKFGKMVAFLRSPLGQRVRTNNHVERMSRVLRGYEKARYKWRLGGTCPRWPRISARRASQGGHNGGAERLQQVPVTCRLLNQGWDLQRLPP
jgi:hypothetical protein